jgi:hypothetical protein
MDGEKKAVLLCISLIVLCITIIYGLLLCSLWEYRVYVNASILGVILFVVLLWRVVEARGKLTEQELFQVGSTAIQVQNEQFQYGYQQGYARFRERYAHLPLTDLAVYHFVLRNILDAFTSEVERAGYITGWMAALVEQQQQQHSC